MRPDLPSGTVTFLFTDVEGSTRLLHELGAESYAEALAEHRGVIREACAAHDGVEVDTQGDAFFFAFPTASGAVAAAAAFTEALEPGPIQVRVGVHTGTPLVTDEGYVGEDVHRAARIAAAGHGGQVLVSASTAPLIGAELADLGEHRFKDLGAPERVHQLGESSFPPLKTLYQTNLPVPQTPFLGREKELAEVMVLLAREDVRLLTLTGPGGTGKTRLAAQAAGALADRYPHGVFWVPLAPIRDPGLVLEAVAKAVGSPDGLATHVRDKRLLLLLDNFEQVVDAAPDVSSLLGECPNVEVLVTSRALLHLSGEHEYPVLPLAHEEGVGFFAARARAISPSFEADDTVSEICRRLDDLPLALELAAARVKALSAKQILARLDKRLSLLTGGARDAPERQRTLAATIAWSHDLLSAEKQALFAGLSVFRGGCTLDAVEAVCAGDVDMLQSLVEESLVRFSDERYWMLESIREFAGARLVESGACDEARERHAAWYGALCDSSYREWRGPHANEWFARFERELDNLRAAIEWALTHDIVLALTLVASSGTFWAHSGRSPEGRRLLEAAWSEDVPPDLRLRALQMRSAIALDQSDLDALKYWSDERLRTACGIGDRFHEAAALMMLGGAAKLQGDPSTARRLYEESIVLWREIDDTNGLSATIGNLAMIERDEGNVAKSRELLEENLAISRAEGSDFDVLWAVKELAMTAVAEGALEDARRYISQGFELASRLRSLLLELDLVFASSWLALESDQPRAAAVLAGATFAMDERIDGDYASMPGTRALNRRLGDALDASELESLAAEGRALDHEDAVRYACEWLASA